MAGQESRSEYVGQGAERQPSEARHTPGPWNAGPAPRLGFVAWTDALGDLTNTGEEGEANARLIAAAPTMYDNIREALGELKWEEGEVAERVRALLTRAIEGVR